MIENLNSKLYEKYEIRRKTENEQEINIALKEIQDFAKMLNLIKEERPASNCKIWISFESEIRKWALKKEH